MPKAVWAGAERTHVSSCPFGAHQDGRAEDAPDDLAVNSLYKVDAAIICSALKDAVQSMP